MRTAPPVLNRSGYLLEADALWLLQTEGWVSLRLDDVAQLKQVSVATAVLRLSDGRKKTLTLSHLSTRGYSAVIAALKHAVRQHREAHALADARTKS